MVKLGIVSRTVHVHQHSIETFHWDVSEVVLEWFCETLPWVFTQDTDNFLPIRYRNVEDK